jgi:D-ribose pyranose/furanose isomerase RbsD
MDTYKVVFKEGETEGVYAISLVEEPAIGVEFVALSKQEPTEIKLATVSEEKKMLLGAILIPDLPIYRRAEDGKEFNIVFDSETIKQVQANFSKQGYLNNSTIEHDGKPIENVTFVETWIKEDEVHDKSVKYGFKEPIGTWFALMKVNDDEVWNDYVKSGKVKGFSIDGVFDLQKINFSNMNLESIVNAIKEGFASLKLNSDDPEKAEVVLSKEMLVDGVTTVEAESFEAGQAVFVVGEDGTQTPAPSGEHQLQSGKIIVVDDAGMITEVKEVETEVETEMATETPNINEILKAFISEVGVQMEKMKTELRADIKKELETVKSKPVSMTKANPSNEKPFEEMTALERFRATKLN